MEPEKINSLSALDEAISLSESVDRLIICGDKESYDQLSENAEYSDQSTEEIVDASKKIDVLKWFEEKKAQLSEDWETDITENEGDWPGEITEKQGFTLTNDIITGAPLTDLYGVRLTSDCSWKIPAILKYGGWNDCPSPEEHCAIWRYWEEKYGAKIIGVSGDVVEAIVTNPPVTREQSMELAWQQYLYCYDIVDQGVETVSNLGASLSDNKFWFFWWD